MRRAAEAWGGCVIWTRGDSGNPTSLDHLGQQVEERQRLLVIYFNWDRMAEDLERRLARRVA
jgi:hypothetical protein